MTWTAATPPTGSWTTDALPTATPSQVMLLLALCSVGTEWAPATALPSAPWTASSVNASTWSVDSLP